MKGKLLLIATLPLFCFAHIAIAHNLIQTEDEAMRLRPMLGDGVVLKSNQGGCIVHTRGTVLWSKLIKDMIDKQGTAQPLVVNLSDETLSAISHFLLELTIKRKVAYGHLSVLGTVWVTLDAVARRAVEFCALSTEIKAAIAYLDIPVLTQMPNVAQAQALLRLSPFELSLLASSFLPGFTPGPGPQEWA